MLKFCQIKRCFYIALGDKKLHCGFIYTSKYLPKAKNLNKVSILSTSL